MIEPNQEITVMQAYKAMLAFLEREYNLTHSDELGGLLGGYQLTSDSGATMDPAAWPDWVSAINQVLEGDKTSRS